MSIESMLTSTCTIAARANTDTVNAMNEPVGGYADPVSTACALQAIKGGQMLMEGRTVVADYKLYLPAGTAITEESRIADVVTKGGTTILAAGEVTWVDPDVAGQGDHVYALVKKVAVP